jgi:hypothetical protein
MNIKYIPYIIDTFYRDSMIYNQEKKINKAIYHAHPSHKIILYFLEHNLNKKIQFYIDNYIFHLDIKTLLILLKWSIKQNDHRFQIIYSKIPKNTILFKDDSDDIDLFKKILNTENYHFLIDELFDGVSCDEKLKNVVIQLLYTGDLNIVKKLCETNNLIKEIFSKYVLYFNFFNLPENVFIYLWKKFNCVLDHTAIYFLIQNIKIQSLLFLLTENEYKISKNDVSKVLNTIHTNQNSDKVKKLYKIYNTVDISTLLKKISNELLYMQK